MTNSRISANETDSGTTTTSLNAPGIKGPLAELHKNKYKYEFLQFPNNLEAAEENHWIRFDIYKLGGGKVKAEESRRIFETESKTFIDRTIENTAEKANALFNTALQAPVNIAKSIANEFVNELPPALGGIGKELLGLGRAQARGLGSIMLYAPHERRETLSLKWEQESVGALGAALLGGHGHLADTITNHSNETINSMLANKAGLTRDAMAKIAGSMLGNQHLEEIARHNEGVALNPHLEMFFNQVNFRTFTFGFKLAPRNNPEAETIRNIIALFKYSSAPRLAEGKGGLYFDYPNVFNISFSNENETHKIAQSALTQVDVNYTGAGVNSTFYDNYPVEVDLSLSFTELEIMHKDKISKGY